MTYGQFLLQYLDHLLPTAGAMPGIPEANHNEPLLPWGAHNQGRIVLGASMEQACASPSDVRFVLQHGSKDSKYILAYRTDHKKVYILLKQGAQSTDCLKANFAAHLFLYLHDKHQLHSSWAGKAGAASPAGPQPAAGSGSGSSTGGSSAAASGSSKVKEDPEAWKVTLQRSLQLSDAVYPEFVRQAEKHGWKLQQTMLNPKETRLVKIMQPL